MPAHLKCSGPMPIPVRMRRYRAAQRRAQQILNELGYPISMGLIHESHKLIRELQEAVEVMKKGIK